MTKEEKMQQKILCIPAEKLFAKGKWNGVMTENLDYYTELLREHSEFRTRGPLEEDPNYKQIIGQVVLQVGDKFLIHKITEKGSESRLHNLWPMMVGGHIEEIDVQPGQDVLERGILREFEEEANYRGNVLNKELVGLLYIEDENPVNHMHVGLVYKFVGDKEEVAPTEDAIAEMQFVDIDYATQNKDQLNYWSREIIPYLSVNTFKMPSDSQNSQSQPRTAQPLDNQLALTPNVGEVLVTLEMPQINMQVPEQKRSEPEIKAEVVAEKTEEPKAEEKDQYGIPMRVRKLAEESSKYFHSKYNEFVYYRTYSRWIDGEGRRETWIETVGRYMDFMRENLGEKLTEKEYSEVREAVLNQEAMPSMRLLQFAGKAARVSNVAAYNCSFVAPDRLQDFGEILFILTNGTGVGFSVEAQNVEKLPEIKMQTGEILPTYVIPDSREGWADALVFGMKTWMDGQNVQFDYSQVRPAGSRLKTFGGRASGPGPLKDLLNFTRGKIMGAQGRKLTTLEVHDIICKIGEVVVAGGVRRSALISLSDLSDQPMRDAKIGAFWETEAQRAMSNNSAVYNEKPTVQQFMEEWVALMKSGTGERGIFNRAGLHKSLPERRRQLIGKAIEQMGTNPCGEIALLNRQFCNLTEVVARPQDTKESLERKVRVAAILGTYQATLTNFPYLSKEWKENCESERLLGVGITGQWDNEVVRNAETLQGLRAKAIEVNREYAERFGINASTCITTVKPSGNLSQTVDCSSGMHPRYAPYYIRRVRINANDPLFMTIRDQGIAAHPEVGQTEENATTFVLDFPVKSPEGSVYRYDLSAIEQLEYWKLVKTNYTEHNPSITVYINENEWIQVANWLYENWDIVGGLSFLPRDESVYQLAPYEEITKDKYEEMKSKMPELDFALLGLYEFEDTTDVKKELACVGGACEIV